MTPFEPERYELRESPKYAFDLDFSPSRRDFFKALGGGILIVSAIAGAEAQESGGGGNRGAGRQRAPVELGAWLHVGETGEITVYTGKVEVGQNARTSLTQAVCEELRAPASAVKLTMGDTDLTPYDAGTFGSRTTPDMFPRLRKAAAAAREILLDLAAEQWKAAKGELEAADGRVVWPARGRSIDFGALTRGRKLMQSIEAAPVTPAEAWKICGQPARKVNGRELVTGKHAYVSDLKLPGMLHGKIVRPEKFEATLESVDSSAAAAIPGAIVAREGDFLGVAAPSPHEAARAAAAIRARWRSAPQPSGRDLFQILRAGANAPAAPEADVALQATYTIAYIAHVPLEPRAAVAQWNEGRLTVWTGTQRPFGVRSELARAFQIPESRVRVIVPDTGGAYGGKHTGEAALEAARLAAAAKRPVKLVWSREEEFTWAYFRPAGVIDIASGADRGGALTAWEFHNYNSGSAGIRTPYDVAVVKTEFHPVRSPLRQGSYRALASTANHFARESHMDELAHALKMDPLAFRRRNLKDERLRAVLDRAAEAFGWGRSAPAKGCGYGIAAGTEKGGYVATCAEVSVDAAGAVKVARVVTAFECGAIVNPDQLRNQVEGSTLMGIGGALFEGVEFEDGKILNAKLAKYRVPRFSDLPSVEAVLVDRKDLASAGAGESTMVALAPAIGNAIFAASGERLRSLPMAPRGIGKS